MSSRRTFLKQSALGAAALGTPCLSALAGELRGFENRAELRISLAQWSLHRALKTGEIKAEDFPRIARETYGIGAVEYVNKFYLNYLAEPTRWKELRRQADSEGVKSLLIMVDEEGDLGASGSKEQAVAVHRHALWL